MTRGWVKDIKIFGQTYILMAVAKPSWFCLHLKFFPDPFLTTYFFKTLHTVLVTNSQLGTADNFTSKLH